MRIIITTITTLALLGCAAFWAGVRTVADVARCLCEVTAAEQLEAEPEALGGMSAEEWCEDEKNLRPFVESVTAAQQAAGMRAGLIREEAGGEPVEPAE